MPRRHDGAAQTALRFMTISLLGLGLVLSCAAGRNTGTSKWTDTAAREERPDSDTAAIMNHARPGDILLRRGKGLASDLIVSSFAGSGGWSHCALVVPLDLFAEIGTESLTPRIGFGEPLENIRTARLLVIHSVDEGLSGIGGVQIQSLEDFCTYSVPGSSALYRPKIDSKGQHSLLSAARQAVLDGIPFDRLWDSSTAESQYCSEFIWRLFESAALSGKKEWNFVGGIVAFTNFSDPVLFEAVPNTSIIR